MVYSLPGYGRVCTTVVYASLCVEGCTPPWYASLCGRKVCTTLVCLPVSPVSLLGKNSSPLPTTRFTVGQEQRPSSHHPFHCWARKRRKELILASQKRRKGRRKAILASQKEEKGGIYPPWYAPYPPRGYPHPVYTPPYRAPY